MSNRRPKIPALRDFRVAGMLNRCCLGHKLGRHDKRTEPRSSFRSDEALCFGRRCRRVDFAAGDLVAAARTRGGSLGKGTCSHGYNQTANGSLEQLKAVLDLASVDWRDLLVSSGLAVADWQAVLTREGFLVP